MSAEPRQITNTEVWTQWEGKVVNGTFPLRRLLGGSIHSGVFLSEQTAENRPDVAIKFVPADTVQAEAQLVQWGANAALAHPNLVRIFDVGRYRADGREYLFVVMEYAEQTLAEILPRRALTVEEARELLLPTLDTLLFLHRKSLIHGRLKPSNFLAVDDRLKLSSDTIRPISHSAIGRVRTSAYDAPELKDRGMNAAADIWSLGMTLLEALTQRTTAWPDETVSLPADLPAPFASTVLKCLSVVPAARPTVLDLEAQHKPVTSPPSTPAAQPSVRQAPPARATPAHPTTKQPVWRRLLAVAPPVSVAAWAVWHVLGPAPAPPPPAAVPTPPPVAPSIVSEPAEPEVPAADAPLPVAPSAAVAASEILHEVTPEVPPAALERIRGRIHVTVRVLVDPDGNVMGTLMENPGPSKLFADLAEQAAGEWRFAPATKQNPRVWLVLFVFSRDGVSARATAQ
jgi:serine/threonine protein kinase